MARSIVNSIPCRCNSIAMALAKLCDGTCKALRWHLQSIPLGYDTLAADWR